MTDNKIKESIQIAEELANEICTGIPSTSPMVEEWKEKAPQLYAELRKQEHLPQEISFHDSIDVKEALRKMNKHIATPSRTIGYRMMGIAASFLIIVGAATLWLWNGEQQQMTAEWTTTMPGSSKPSIVGQDNRNIELPNNKLAVEDNQLIGRAMDGKKNVAIELNTNYQFNKLSVPAGGEYELTLEDGTVVQVNAASELLFPTHFKKHVRQVRLMGEACFKVKTNKLSPFIVQLGTLNVQVTGTTFNIKAYEEEDNIRITLIEGSVNVREGQNLLATLTPGQQLTYQKMAREYNVSEPNLSAITDWTNGQFIFYDEPIGNIMKELSRWYNVNIQVSDDIKAMRYSGILSRKQPLADMLDALRLTQELDFKIHGNKQIDAIEKGTK